MLYFFIFVLVLLQNASFTLVSRARNSNSVLFHGIAAALSNGVWLIVIKKVVSNFDDPWFTTTYITASVAGSLLMHYVSMHYIEKFFNSKPKKDV